MKAYNGQKPGVGRMVYYHITADPEPFAAIIVSVDQETPGECSLFVFPKNQLADVNEIIHCIPFSEDPKPMHWTWIPET